MPILLQHELVVIVGAYLMAGLPVGGIAVASRMSPLYGISRGYLCRWWSWGALLIVLGCLADAIIRAQ